MILKLFCTFFLITFYYCASHAQKVEWSDAGKPHFRFTATEIVGKNSDGGYIVMRKNSRAAERNIVVEKYSPLLKKTAEREILLKKTEYYGQAILNGNTVKVFYASVNKETKKLDLIVKQLNTQLEDIGKDTIIFSVPDNEASRKFLNIYSEAGNVFFTYIDVDNSKPGEVHCLLYDSALTLKFSTVLNCDFTGEFDIQNAAFSSSAFTLLIREDVKKKVSKQGYELYLLTGFSSRMPSIKTPLFNDSLSVYEGKLNFDSLNDAFVFAGLYSTADSGYCKGYFFWKKPVFGKEIMTVRSFPNAIFEGFTGKSTMLQGIYNMRISKQVLRNDGGVVQLAEEYQETKESLMDMNMYGIPQSNFRYYYYYDNILVLSLNPQGELDWSNIVHKSQVSINDNGEFSSFFMMKMTDKLFFIYNDLARKNWNVDYYTQQTDGSGSNDILIRSQNYTGKLIPREAKQTAYNEVLFPGNTGKGEAVVRITF